MSEPLVNMTDRSEEFMYADLAASGLQPEDFPHGCRPLTPTKEGAARYRIEYDRRGDYWKDIVEGGTQYGPKGVTIPTPLIASKATGVAAKFTASVVGYKSALLFTKTTGIGAVVLDSPWAFSIATSEDAMQVKNEVLENINADKVHFVLYNGNWEDPDVGRAIASYALLLDEVGVQAIFPDFNGRGYDDWYTAMFQTKAFDAPPEPRDVIKALLALPRIPVSELAAAKSMAVASAVRFNKSHVDFSDRGNATLLTKLIGPDNMRYLHDTGQWVFWDQDRSRWVLYEGSPIERANEVGRHYFRRSEQLYKLAAEMAKDGDKMTSDPVFSAKQKAAEKQAAKCYSWARDRCSTVAGRRAIIEDVSSRQALRVLSTEFDADPDVLAVPGGVVSLRSGQLREEKREDLILARTGAAYDGTEPTGESVDRVKMFVRQITGSAHGALDAESMSWLQRRLGASLRGVNALDSLEIWYGTGANGKSVLAKLVGAALGDYCSTIPPSVLLSAGRDRDPEAPSPFLMEAKGKRIVFAAETKDTQYLNEQLVKNVTGGDRIAARGMYQGASKFEVTFTPVLLSNDLPNIAQGDDALWDRLAPFDFRVRWQRPNRVDVDEEERSLPMGDLWLRDEAAKDGQALAWVLWWMVRGGVEWEAAGRKVGEAPAHVREGVQGYKGGQDRLGRWMEEAGWQFVAPGSVGVDWTLSREIYLSYSNWSVAEGSKPERNSVFGKRLVAYAKGQVTAGKKDSGKQALVGIVRVDQRGAKF